MSDVKIVNIEAKDLTEAFDKLALELKGKYRVLIQDIELENGRYKFVFLTKTTK